MNEQKQFQILSGTIEAYEEKLKEIQIQKNALVAEESVLLNRLDAVRDIRDKWGMSAAGDVPRISTYEEIKKKKLQGTRLGKKKLVAEKHTSICAQDSFVSQIKKIVMAAEKEEMTTEEICSKLRENSPGYSVNNTHSLLHYLLQQGHIDKRYSLTPEGKRSHRCTWSATEKLKEKETKLRAV